MKSRASALFVSLFLFLVPAIALAGAVKDYLQTKQVELTELVKTDAPSEKLVTVFDALLDYPALAEASLGDEWAKITPEQRAEFQKLLQVLVQRAYKKNIKETLAYDITFQNEVDAAKGKLVKTTAKHKTEARKPTISIDYLVHQVGGKWRVYDIITEESSLVANYRNQFRQVIQKKGFSGLLETMNKKANEK